MYFKNKVGLGLKELDCQLSNTSDSRKLFTWYIIISLASGSFFTFLIFSRLISAGYAPGNLGDARFNIFVLEHVYKFLTLKASSFSSPQIFFPFPDALFFSDTHVGSVVPYALLRIIGLSEFDAFRGWFVFGYFATYLSAFYALRQFGLKAFPTVVAAGLFTFCLPSLVQWGHSQLIYRCGIPLATAYLWRSLCGGSVRDLMIASIWMSLQILMGIYLGAFLALSMLSFSVIYLLLKRIAGAESWVSRICQDWKALIVTRRASDLFLILISFCALAGGLGLLAKYAQVARLYGLHRDIAEISVGLPRLYSYLSMYDLPYWTLRFSLPAIPQPQRAAIVHRSWCDWSIHCRRLDGLEETAIVERPEAR